MRKYHLFSAKRRFANVYDNITDASIINGFGVAAFRYGHSQVMPQQSLLSDDMKTVVVNKLEDNFLSPNLWQRNHGQNIPNFARWLAMKPAMRIDRYGTLLHRYKSNKRNTVVSLIEIFFLYFITSDHNPQVVKIIVIEWE